MITSQHGRHRPIYIDIDGTLTDAPHARFGNPHFDRIGGLKRLVRQGREVVLWSGGGTEYAVEFAIKYDIEGVTAIGKPDIIVDDNPFIRPVGKMPIVQPIALLKVR